MSQNIKTTYDNKFTALTWSEMRDYVFNYFIKKYFPETYNNFNSDLSNDSLAKMMLETNIALTDIQNFYLNDQYKETNINTAEQEENVWALSKQQGYLPSFVYAATVKSYLYFTIPAKTSAPYEPDEQYVPIAKAGTSGISNNGAIFELQGDVNMSQSLNTSDMVVAETDVTGSATKYALRAVGKFIAGKQTTYQTPINSFVPFRRVALPETNVLDVQEVIDSRGNKYHKVDYLAQDIVFEKIYNTMSDQVDVPYVLYPKRVPYRFTIDRDPVDNITYVQFGAGNQSYLSTSLLIPDPSMYSVDIFEYMKTLSVPIINPEMITESLSLGISPDTDIVIKYRIGGGDISNIGAGDMRSPYSVNVDFNHSGLDATKRQAVIDSFGIKNFEASDGGKGKDSVEIIRQVAPFTMNAQNRLVTPEDFISRVYSMPSYFGSAYKIAVEPLNESNTVRLYILTKDSEGNLKLPSDTLLDNIVSWISCQRLMAEGIDLLPGEIINLKLNFRIVVEKKYNAEKILYNCIGILKDNYSVDKMLMGGPIVISQIIDTLQEQEGVFSVDDVYFTENFTVNSPKISRFRIRKYLRNGILFCPPYSCFEILSPNANILGVAV